MNYESMSKRLGKCIWLLAPVRYRILLRQFNYRERSAVAALLKRWSEQGAIKLSGTGRRGSPIIVSKP